MGKTGDRDLENFQARGHSFAPYGQILGRQIKTVTEVLKTLEPEAPVSHHGTHAKPPNNIFIFSPALNWF